MTFSSPEWLRVPLIFLIILGSVSVTDWIIIERLWFIFKKSKCTIQDDYFDLSLILFLNNFNTTIIPLVES